MDSADDLANYWGDLTPSNLGLFSPSRKLTYGVREPEKVREGVTIVPVELLITLDLRATGIGSKARKGGVRIRGKNAVRIVGCWPVYERDGLWYLLGAGIPEGSKAARLA